MDIVSCFLYLCTRFQTDGIRSTSPRGVRVTAKKGVGLYTPLESQTSIQKEYDRGFETGSRPYNGKYYQYY